MRQIILPPVSGFGSLRRRLLKIVMMICGAAAFAISGAPGAWADGAWDELKKPGRIAIMRHALAPGTGDPATFQLRDCSTQRNLDDRGRRQARAIGRAMKTAGVAFDKVLSSQWCRCLETARMLDMGEVQELPPLNSFFQNYSLSESQTRALRQFLSGPDQQGRLMLVTHQVNITALTGRGVSSGEVLILERAPGGEVRLVDSVLIDP